MGFQANVLRVLIASPSDVKQQRDEIESAIFEWNKQYAESLQTVLLPGRWEDDVIPSYGGVDAQQVINDQLVSKCDILIGVFWTKLGTATTKHSSGTLEEIAQFIEQGKEVMLYFVEDHVPRSSDFGEIAKVDAYKREYGKKGIYATYEPSKIVNHLYAKVSNLNKTPVLSGFVKADDETLEHSKSLSENKVNSLILSGLLTRNELLILGYILDTGNRSFGFRWMSEDSKLSIQKWEQEMLLASDLKNDYNNVIENLAERELLIPKEHTGYGNVRLYVMPLSTFNDLRTISEEAKGEIAKAIKECSFPF